MKLYKDPSFQDRVARAAEAKQKALEQLKARPPLDEKVVAERRAARLAREAAQAERRAAAQAEREQARADKAAEIEQAKAEAAARVPKLPTAAELKAARDARYAARKDRK